MRFSGTEAYVATDDLKVAVNAAVTLERPLLVKGEPGTGKTELARQVAETQGTSVAGVYTWPLLGLITTEFGGCTFGQCPHIGIDIAGDMHAPVVAANDGIVLVADYVVPGNRQASYGMIVVIAHNQNE